MEECSLPRIPDHLHSKGRPDLPLFEVGEYLYRRCKPLEVEDPFATVRLTDLSVNRQGPTNNRPLCEPEDVLRDFSVDAQRDWIEEQKAIALTIKEVNEQATYRYETSLVDDAGKVTAVCVMVLVHDQEPCNYAHCAFQLWFNEEEVTRENYKKGFGRNQYNDLRDRCKFQLARMIKKRAVWLPPAA